MVPWVPQQVVRDFLQTVLRADAAVLEEVDAEHILPDIGIPATVERTLVHEFAGGMRMPTPIGGSPSLAVVPWDITGWEPSASRLSLNPLMVAVKRLLIGDEMRGRTHLFAFDGQSYAIDCDMNIRDPAVPVPLDQTSPQTWAPVRERYLMTVRPRWL